MAEGRKRLPRYATALAKGVHLAVLADALSRLDAAERAGRPYEEAGPEVAAALAAGWTASGAPRLALTVNNAAEQALALGRIEALQADTAARPFWYFSAVGDDRTSEVCEACDGTLLPASHSWWATHVPGLHLLCRSSVLAVTAAQARAMGAPIGPPPDADVEVEEGFGTVADLCSWEPLPGAYPVELHEPFWPVADGSRRSNADRSAPAAATRLDLAPADVHVPSSQRRKTMSTTASKRAPKLTPKQRRDARAAAAKEKQDAAAVKAAGLSPVRRRGLHMRIGLAADGGHTVEVLHAADGDGVVVHGEGCELAVLASDTSAAAPVWNQLTKLGAWQGHPAGPFEITRQTNAEIVRNFKATANQRIPVDFEHASEAPGDAGSIPADGAPAQGWITDLDDRGAQGLWGLIQWLEPARTYILEGKYKFFSPAIRFGSKDRVTGRPIGARMTSGACTNIPFLDGLQPLAAADRGGATPMLNRPLMSHDFMARMRAALRLDDTAPMERMSGKCADLRDLCMTADGAMMSQGVDLKPYLSELGGLMNMPAHSEVGEILDAVEAMIDAAMEQHEAMYHAGSEPDDGGPTTTSSTDSAEGAQTTMSDQDKALAVQLGEEKQKTATVSAERDALRTEGASLSLRLKDAESRATEATVALGAKDAELVALKAAMVKRDEAEQEATVTCAFDTYKDARKLKDDDKAAMRITLKADPALFGRLYPAVAPNQRHLLADLTGARTSETTTSTATGEPAARGMSVEQMTALSDKYQKEGMSPERAIGRAYAEAQAASKAAPRLFGGGGAN